MATLRLILWPVLLTWAISVARMVAEVEQTVSNVSGGRGVALGIAVLVPVFGAWFGWRLRRQGSRARSRNAWVWPIVALALIVATVAWRFGPLVGAAPSEDAWQQVRASVLIILAVAIPAALLVAAAWPRLALTLFAYALPVRLFVVAQTWLAKHMAWDTHYTKFGPPGIERDMADTVLGASLAQLGFWVPFTIVVGALAGVWFGRGAAQRPARPSG